MPSGRIKDWSALTEANVEIRKQGTPICSGTVDAVTEDGKILWIHSTAEGRRLFEKSAFFEVARRRTPRVPLQAGGRLSAGRVLPAPSLPYHLWLPPDRNGGHR
ncbi:hypothetical protein [Arthrobacter sp. PM3]|uniref:hypothetical protein n=1 Tax=Arthrobacter sp. PM3 TaxID=2017685 RepID=UPI000E10D16A|nr:hypothetical protein [Arthrobacter sp. PM3]AXJ10019.1 hypothetical protein CFN17_10580 [Arthrobacter sp. PM3]